MVFVCFWCNPVYSYNFMLILCVFSHHADVGSAMKTQGGLHSEKVGRSPYPGPEVHRSSPSVLPLVTPLAGS